MCGTATRIESPGVSMDRADLYYSVYRQDLPYRGTDVQIRACARLLWDEVCTYHMAIE